MSLGAAQIKSSEMMSKTRAAQPPWMWCQDPPHIPLPWLRDASPHLPCSGPTSHPTPAPPGHWLMVGGGSCRNSNPQHHVRNEETKRL